MVSVVQLVEHRIVVPSVVGSSPITHPQKVKRRIRGAYFLVRKSNDWCEGMVEKRGKEFRGHFFCLRKLLLSSRRPILVRGNGGERGKRVLRTFFCPKKLFPFREGISKRKLPVDGADGGADFGVGKYSAVFVFVPLPGNLYGDFILPLGNKARDREGSISATKNSLLFRNIRI